MGKNRVDSYFSKFLALPNAFGQNNWVYFSIKLNFLKISKASFACHGVLNKDSTVGLDGAGSGEYCIQPTFLRNATAQPCIIPISKNTFTGIEN